MKNQYRGEDCLKRGRLGQFVDLRSRGFGKKEGVVFFEGGRGLIPQCTLCMVPGNQRA